MREMKCEIELNAPICIRQPPQWKLDGPIRHCQFYGDAEVNDGAWICPECGNEYQN